MPVLNALRHLSERRELRPVPGDIALEMCSTPYGISASGGLRSKLSPASASVCSTPYGISASGGVGFIEKVTPPEVCSTPYGISASGGIHTARRVLDLQVLNALRHLSERRKSSIVACVIFFSLCSTPYGISASGGRISICPDSVLRCSTPYGISASGGHDCNVNPHA